MPVPTRTELFLGFFKIGMLGFGGVAPIARHVIVDDRKWLTDAEFATVLGLGQVLPGPNVVNASIVIGDRFAGPTGVLACLAGQMAAPILIVVLLATVFDRIGGIPWVGAALLGAAAAAAGMVAGTAIKLGRRTKAGAPTLLVGAAAFAAIGLLQWPLVPVVLSLIPLALLASWWERRA